MSEFDLINHFFKSTTVNRADVLLGIGDDCAILSPPDNKKLAVSTDTLISGVHFPESASAEDIGYKSLAVNLSDLAAMGAEPAWVSLAISLPEANKVWLKNFISGFNELAEKFNVALIGGDTTQGPLSVTINVTGFVDPDKALKRSNASPGDFIFVTGDIGDAHLGLKSILNDNFNNRLTNQQISYCEKKLNRPQPRFDAGNQLKTFSASAIDISDGLLADLSHICKASNVGAVLNIDKIPVSDALLNYYQDKPDWHSVLTAGDDYELCFTCPKSQSFEMQKIMKENNVTVSCIGEISENTEIICKLNNQKLDFEQTGYNHF
ncbi:MAG: thiamine-phosphate kinase [endosymbiont of Galathealinum brachiosum]|uniref:Thiamine-monophosphate kinase n=1 Tax=endosymbiont of Galathealinum brachiosum TaxID=2200906 RepID=A0A370DGP0_9GAMM|nr:MAG: thiamine-phosphate kinase [endosymbiont of Galathealinum brachiosum]